MQRAAHGVLLLALVVSAQDGFSSVRVIQAAVGLAKASVTVQNQGNFSAPDLQYLDITAYENTSSSANPYSLVVNSKSVGQDSISVDWATVAILGNYQSAPLLFVHFTDDISGSFLNDSGTVRAIHMFPGAPPVSCQALNNNGTVVTFTVAYPQSSEYYVIPSAQTLFNFTVGEKPFLTEPLFINAGTVYTLWIVPTLQGAPEVLMTQDWPPDVP